ncbi:maestro heat-like repeat-containing protein family member 1 [Tubulanus polymorphus]|uniref:maestro heat-like repeat-containing protein family member 1 n=1 Tax=Tubulanus polymorphus TaxID=672921 RepID=UPI003DA3AFAD
MIMPGPEECDIRATGGKVDELAMALIDAAHDKSEKVRNVISSSLVELGKKQPAMVLSSCHAYIAKHTKLGQGHRVIILSTMEKIIKETLDEIKESLALDIITLASDELTKSKEVVPDWQTAASGVLVAMGKRYIIQVMEELLKKLVPGTLPHFFVIQTLGNLATSNVYGMVPFIRVVLGTMLPMLGMAKLDNVRWVFAAALGKFCDAILDYVANIENAPDTSVTKESFSAEMYSAYDVLFNVWLQSKEPKLRIAIVETVGHMAHIITLDKLEEQLPRLLPGIIALYKRNQEPYYVTQGLCYVLDAATRDGCKMLEIHLDNLLNNLFPQVCHSPDYSNPYTIKNHNELLRCFAVLTRSFSDRLVGFLLQKLENNNEKIRVGALSIFRHIVNAADDHMENKQSLVVSGLKIMLNETNNKVKKSFAQVIIAMADHGYLELEGGELMVEFIIRQCALPADSQSRRPTDAEYVSNDALRSMCGNILQLATTTVEKMEAVLWPYLLEFIVPDQYVEALGSVCKCIAHLAGKKREENADDYMIVYDEQVNVPKPTALIARLFVLAGLPKNGQNRGVHVLNAMKALSPTLHENLVNLWDTVIPKLIQFLEDSIEDDKKWSQKSWEDLLLKMLSKSLDEVEYEDWICELGEDMKQQLSLYHSLPEEKNFLYKSLGIVMRKTTKKDFVTNSLDVIFGTVKHTEQLEREGCAIALGFCASSHLDTVLTKLEMMSKTDSNRKTSFLKIFTDKSEGPNEQMKATLMLCYGYVTLYGPPSLIVSRIEASILRTIDPQFTSVKDSCVKQNLIRAVELIAKALHPSHLQMAHNFTKKSDLLTYLENYLKAESLSVLNSETRALCLSAAASLVKLDPKLSEADVFTLVKVAMDSVYGLPCPGVSGKKSKEESYETLVEKEALLEVILDSLNDMLNEILMKDLNPEGFESIFKHVVPWMVSVSDHERQRAVLTTLSMLTCYQNKMQLGMGQPDMMSNAGSVLGYLVPRCTDPDLLVRQTSIDCVQIVLKIILKYEGHSDDHHDKMVDALPTLKDRLKKGDSNVLYSVINDLSKVFTKKVPPGQLIQFCDRLCDGLLDAQSHSSSGVCVVLNNVAKSRGGEFHHDVERILGVLQKQLKEISFPQTRTGTLRCIRIFATNHLNTTLSTFLNYNLPYDEDMGDSWKMIAQDPQLAQNIIDFMLDMLSRSLPYEEKPDPKDKKKTIRVAMPHPLAIACALGEMFKVEEMKEVMRENFHRLLAAIMILMASMVGTKPPKPKEEPKDNETKSKDKKDKKSKKPPVSPSKDAQIEPCSEVVATFQTFLMNANCEGIMELLEGEEAWKKFEDEETYPEAFGLLAKGVAGHESQNMTKIVASLNVVLSSLYDPQRIAVAAFFAELVNQRCSGDMTLVELLVNSLLGRLVDNNYVVRKMCIRGMGNVASVGSEQVQKFSTTVLSAMMAGMDDKEDPEDDITLEAMSGLSKILAEIDEANIRAILINIALRIRPCFEKDKASVRAAAFTLFGNLSRFGDGPSKAPFLEQTHSNLVSLLMHLNDPDSDVVKSCKYALRLLGPLMGSDDLNNMFQKFLLDEGHLHYGEFINDLVKVLIHDFPDKINFYVMGGVAFFKSMWSEIRSNAGLFVGFLLGNLPKEKHANVSKEHVCGALVLLLKDEDADTRCKAAEAMSLLHDY